MKDYMYDKILMDGIKDFDKKIEAYASWVINGGIRFQKGWALGIACPVTCPDLARALTHEAYNQGARDVTVYWADPYTDRENFAYSEEQFLENAKPWPDRCREKYGNKDLAFVIVYSTGPDFLESLDVEKQLRANAWQSTNFQSFKRGLEIPYTICAASNREWARCVFPDLDPNEAYIKVWENLFEVARIDGNNDPVQEWFNHCDEMQKHADQLNDFHFESLHFTSEIGTDCTFKLPKTHKWVATAENTSTRGTKFSANMPTEEVFCVPEKYGVNGKIVSEKPLLTKNGVILKPQFEIKDGKIISFSAEKGQDIMEALIHSNKNGAYFGEVAIVPYDTPISRQGITYIHTLFDENSGCHTAIGNAYSKCIEGGLQMTDEELEAAGLNVCKFHEDCVLGTKDTKIVGKTYEGEEITIFEHGAWTI